MYTTYRPSLRSSRSIPFLLAFMGACAPAEEGYDTNQDDESTNDAVVVSPEEALAIDLTLGSQDLGVSAETLADRIEFQESFSRLVTETLSRYPEEVSGSWIDDSYPPRGHIRFVDDVPVDMMELDSETLAFDATRLEFEGGGKVPVEVQTRAAVLAVEALRDDGHTNAVTFYDQRTGRIHVDLRVPLSLATPSESDVSDVVTRRIVTALLAGDDELSLTTMETMMSSLEIELSLTMGHEPLFEPQHGRGGNQLNLSNGTNWCTSAWSVSGPQGDGIITAGHCRSAAQFEEESGTTFGMTLRNFVEDLSGDIAYYTTTHVEPAQFYAREGELRNVTSVQAGFPSIGAILCQYGRASNVRTCDSTVQAVDVNVLFSSGITIGHMVQLNNNSAIGGDSGGGWSFNNTAYGVHSGGVTNGVAYYTPLWVAGGALGAVVKTQ